MALQEMATAAMILEAAAEEEPAARELPVPLPGQAGSAFHTQFPARRLIMPAAEEAGPAIPPDIPRPAASAAAG